jgi:predicted nucleotidyltransferase
MQLIVPIGTRIVTPAGAVGVIVSSPADATHAYRIRFLDDSETSLRREQFRIWRSVRNDALGESEADVDWNQFVIFRCVVGSRAFGLDTGDSDVDRRGFYLPPADLQWSLYGVPEQLENDATQEVYWELGKFIKLALKANPGILEVLYSPLIEHASDLARELLAIRDIFLSRLVYQTYNGYVLSRFKRIESDVRNGGKIKWKHPMHLIRMLISGIRILREHVVPVHVEEHRDRLMSIRRGVMSWDEIEEWRLALHREFDEAFSQTTLPERPDFERANEFLIHARRAMVTA